MEQSKEINQRISVILNSIEEKLIHEQLILKKRQLRINISFKDFMRLYNKFAKLILTRKGQVKNYVIDEDNKQIIEQFYFYLTGSEKFKGDINKGILLAGDIGTGKTIIIQVIVFIIEALTNKIFTSLNSKNLADYLKEYGTDALDKKPLFLDDIGREGKIVNDYGTIKHPLTDLFFARYDNNAKTFATTNFNKNDLIEFYGKSTIDRFREMFNYLTLTGKTRRV